MTLATWLSIGTIIGGLLAIAARWRASRSTVKAARSKAKASEAALYLHLKTHYRTPEIREALKGDQDAADG